MEIAIAIIGSGALSALISGLFSVLNNRNQKETNEQAGLMALLYDRIKYLCKEHIARGKIASNDLEDLERMHQIYHDKLNGNGFLDDLMKAVRELEIVPAKYE